MPDLEGIAFIVISNGLKALGKEAKGILRSPFCSTPGCFKLRRHSSDFCADHQPSIGSGYDTLIIVVLGVLSVIVAFSLGIRSCDYSAREACDEIHTPPVSDPEYGTQKLSQDATGTAVETTIPKTEALTEAHAKLDAEDVAGIDLTWTSQTPPAPPCIAVVGVDSVRLRNGPGTTFDVIGMLEKGERVEVAERRTDWTRIAWPGQAEGPWIRTDLLSFRALEEGCPSGAGTIGVYGKVAVASAVVRNGPGKDHPKTGRLLDKGSVVGVLETSDGWVRVSFGHGETGWVYAKLLVLDEEVSR